MIFAFLWRYNLIWEEGIRSADSAGDLAMLGAIYLPVANAIYFVLYVRLRSRECKKLQLDKESNAQKSLLQVGEGTCEAGG